MTDTYNHNDFEKSDWRPGDRILVKAACMPPGGTLATVQHPGRLAILDCSCEGTKDFGLRKGHSPGDSVGLFIKSNHSPIEVSLFYRDPSPDLSPDLPRDFTRSNGSEIVWKTREDEGMGPSNWVAYTPADALDFAEGYARVANVLEYRAQLANVREFYRLRNGLQES